MQAYPHSTSEQDRCPPLLEIDLDLLRTDFKQLRRQYRLSQAQAARSLHVSQATLSAFENGKHTLPRPQTLLGIREMVLHWQQRNENPSQHNSTIASIPHNTEKPCTVCQKPAPNLPQPPLYCPYCSTPYHHATPTPNHDLTAHHVLTTMIHSGVLTELIRQEVQQFHSTLREG